MQNDTQLSNRKPERDYLFDNIRCLLIFLVVLGHMFTPLKKQPELSQILYECIYLFHVAAFIFCSGYFSKNVDKCRETAVAKFLLPFLLFNLISSILYCYHQGREWYQLNLFFPRWGMWFIFVLFIYRFLIKDLARIRFILPLSFLVGLFSGCFVKLGSTLALSRIFGWLPFFMLGFYLTPERIEKIRKLPKIIPILTGLASLGYAVFAYYNRQYGWTRWLCYPSDIYHMSESFHDAGMRISEGLIARGLIYLFAVLAIFTLIALMPRKKSYLSTIGQNTMPVYILHLFLVEQLKEYDLLPKPGYLFLLFALLFAAAVTLLFSSPPVAKAYNFCMEKLEKLIFRPTLPKS